MRSRPATSRNSCGRPDTHRAAELLFGVMAAAGRVESFNILADTVGDAGHTVVVGAHLDSVQEGPGINDNGSGVAAVLETARWMKEAGITPANRVRFAFWGGEEDGLYGSQHYVDELSRPRSARPRRT